MTLHENKKILSIRQSLVYIANTQMGEKPIQWLKYVVKNVINELLILIF